MTRTLSPSEIAACAQAACLLEVAAPKPGNVSRGHDFRDTSFEDFLLSAAAIGHAFQEAATAGVGATVLTAIQDTRRFVGVNTNLGIVLLLAPLACAAASPAGPLRRRLHDVLAGLTVADARAVYGAIRSAAPGGLGRADAQDVHEEPSVTLREAMALAAGRDTIAQEYLTDYDVTFGLAVPALRQARASGLGWGMATLESYLRILAEVPDTMIARKQGAAVAREVSGGAREVLAAGPPASPERARAAAAFHAELRSDDNARNPGTSADLVAAALFVVLSEGR